jgi:glycosyltransferase involved in cell wall biosynthesis
MILLHVSTDSRTLGFVLQQMLFMRDKGWEVHAMASPGDYGSGLKSYSISFHPIEMHPRINPLGDLFSIARMYRAMTRLRPTVVHAHTLKAGLIAMISATLAGVPIRIFHVHGLPHLAARGLKYRLLYLATRVACGQAHRIFCVSHSIRQILVDGHLCSAGKVVVPANGSCDGIEALERFNPAMTGHRVVNAVRQRFEIPERSFVIAFVGRLVLHKGLVELGKAWILLRSRHPGLHLLIVGDFESQDPVPPDTLEMFRADPRVRMTGLCQNMPELYGTVDLVVLPSHYEGFPTVLLEAAAMGLPAVATAIPGNVDAILDGVTGTLVPPFDARALADAIAGYIESPELRRDHGLRARERVLRDFGAKPIREFIHSDYAGMLSRRGLRLPAPVPVPRSEGEPAASDDALRTADLA